MRRHRDPAEVDRGRRRPILLRSRRSGRRRLRAQVQGPERHHLRHQLERLGADRGQGGRQGQEQRQKQIRRGAQPAIIEEEIRAPARGKVRTAQEALIRAAFSDSQCQTATLFFPPRDSGEGGPRSCAVGGALALTFLLTLQNFRHGPRPLHHASRGPPPASRGRMKQALPFSRCTGIRVVGHAHQFFRSPHRSSSDDTGGGAGAVTICALSHECKKEDEKEGSGTPKDADPYPLYLAVQLAPSRRARLPAFHHGSRQRDVGPQGSAPGQASWDVVSTGVIRCLLSQSGGCTPHTGRNAGEHDARSRPGAEVTSLRPRAPHPVPISRGRRPMSFTANGINRPLFKSRRQCQSESFAVAIVQTNRDVTRRGFLPGARRVRFTQNKDS